MKKMKRFIPVIVAFLFGASLFGAFQYTIAHAEDLNPIYACVKNSNGAVRIVGASETCSGSETSLNWNNQGPQGAQGPQGSPGNSFVVCPTCTKKHILDRIGGTTLENAQLDFAALEDARLANENLSGASLKYASLPRASLRDSDLSNTDFSNTNLKDAIFENSNLTNANFTGADLSFVDMNATITTGANFTDVMWYFTRCPDGTNSSNNDGTCESHLNN